MGRLSRDELVAIVSDYYQFLTTMYIPASSIKFPPPDGWPNITSEIMAGSGKNADVVDLMKYLPYISEEKANEMITNVHYKSDVVDYSVKTKEYLSGEELGSGEESLNEWIEEMKMDRSEDGDDDASDADSDWSYSDEDKIDLANILVLSSGYESGGREILLDVFSGYIYEDMLECSLQSGRDIELYFSDLREKFEKLEMVPIPGDLYEVGQGFSDATEAEVFIKIYKEYGWPGQSYRKEKALEKIAEEVKRRENKASEEA